LSPPLVEAVVAHELGHFALSHSIWTVSFCQLRVLLILLACLMFRREKNVFTTFGLPTGSSYFENGGVDPILPSLLIIIDLILKVPIFVS